MASDKDNLWASLNGINDVANDGGGGIVWNESALPWSGAMARDNDFDAQSVDTKTSRSTNSNIGKKRRSRSILQGRTRVACTHCYAAKAGCDSKRPCSRCVRLNKEDECVDRVHKKRVTNARKRSRRRSTKAGRAASAVDCPSALDMSVELVASRFSRTLGEMWLYQCQTTLEDSLEQGVDAYQDACQRVVQVTEKLLGGLLDARMYSSVRARLQSIGIQVQASCEPVRREPFRLLSAAEAGEPEELRTNGLNIAVVKSVQLPNANGDEPKRGIFINAEARRVFGYSSKELCAIFNRQSSESAFTPFWTWLIAYNDWIKVIRHNAHFFLSLNDPAEQAQRNDDDNTLVLRVINRSGQLVKCLASTRSETKGPQSFSFCFITLGQTS